MFFVKVVALGFLALVSGVVSAGLPMAQRPFTNSQEFAERLRTGSGLNATAEQYIQAYQDYHPDTLRGVRTIEEYARNLELVPCPQGVLYRLKSVERGSLGEITREFKPGEQCFFDRNIGEVVQSASCGNVAKVAESHEPVRSYEPPPRVEYRERVVYRDREVPVYVQPESQYYAPPPQPVVIVEEYGGLDAGAVLSSAAIGWGLSRSGDRYYYDDHSVNGSFNDYSYRNRQTWIDKRRYDDHRQWVNYPRNEPPLPPPPRPCHTCGGGGGGPVNPPTGPIGCPGGNCGGPGGPYGPPGGPVFGGGPINPPTGPVNPPTGYYYQ